MENKTDGIIFNPNLIWLPTPPQMESFEDFEYVDAFLPGSTGERIEKTNYLQALQLAEKCLFDLSAR